MERDTYRKVEINRYKKFKSLKLCNVCSSRLSMSMQCEHLAVFNPKITSFILNIYKELTISSEVKHIFPAMDCSNLCATKVLANCLIENIEKNEPSCLVFVEKLSEKISSLSDDLNFISKNQRHCYLCGLHFWSTSKTIRHLTLRHPEYLALVFCLRYRPLSELNFYINKIVVDQITSEELFQRIASARVLGSRQPIIKIKKLPDLLYQECIAEGCVNLKENIGTWSPQPNFCLNKISTNVIQKLKETTSKSSNYNEKYPVVVDPVNTLNPLQESSDSEGSSCSLNNFNAKSQTASKVICYGVEDLKMDRLRRRTEKEKMMKKQMMLKKMLSKYHEKESRKEIVYWQKGLTGYVKKHPKYLRELKEQLLCARKLLRNKYSYEKLLTQVNSNVQSSKVRKTVKYFLEHIFKAIEKVQTLISEDDGSEQIEQPLLQNVSKVAASEKNEEAVAQNGADVFPKFLNLEPKDPVQRGRTKFASTESLNSNQSYCDKDLELNNVKIDAKKKSNIQLSSEESSFEESHCPKFQKHSSTIKCDEKACSSIFTDEEKSALVKKSKTKFDFTALLNLKKGDNPNDLNNLLFLNAHKTYSTRRAESVKKGSKKKLPSTDLSSEDFCFEEKVETLHHQKISTRKDKCDKKLNSTTTDLFVNPSLVTEDKQLVECYCGKLNCDGLHPENFIH